MGAGLARGATPARMGGGAQLCTLLKPSGTTRPPLGSPTAPFAGSILAFPSCEPLLGRQELEQQGVTSRVAPSRCLAPIQCSERLLLQIGRESLGVPLGAGGSHAWPSGSARKEPGPGCLPDTLGIWGRLGCWAGALGPPGQTGLPPKPVHAECSVGAHPAGQRVTDAGWAGATPW